MTRFNYPRHSRVDGNLGAIMTRFLLLILTIILFQVSFQGNAFALDDKIVAIVNKKPITSSELDQRKKIMKFFGNVSTVSAEQDKAFTTSVLNSMIDGEVLTQHAEKNGIKVSDQEIQNFVRHIETNNKMSEGQFERSVMNLHVTREAFKETIRIEVLRSKIIHDVVGQQVNVTRGEVDSLILDTNSRDAKLSLKVFTSKRNNDKAYSSMSKLSSRIKSCSKISHLRYQSFATVSDLDTTLSALSPNLQGMIKDMHIDQATGVIKGDKLQVYVLCAKKIEGFSDTDATQVHQLVSSKQLNIKARKFLQNLRKKAYVKIVM